MSLTDKQVRDLSILARMELSDAEIVEVRPQLERIFDFVQKLAELDTGNVEPMTTALDVDNCWRDDQIVESLDREAALANAPASDGECFLVPPVLGPSAAKK